jgi:hypothetical protein
MIFSRRTLIGWLAAALNGDLLVAAAFLVRRYAPNNQDIAYTTSPGVMRGVPVNIAAFWLLIGGAIAVAVAYVLRRL